MTDDRQPSKPIPNESQHDDGTDEEPKEWDEQVAEEAGISDEDSNPLPPT